jgi:hypothetical protein
MDNLMIKATQILEEYHALHKSGDEGFPIFINPDQSELKECGDEVRFIADAEHKKVYAWDAFATIHNTIKNQLYLKDFSPSMFWGLASKQGNRYILVTSDEFNNKVKLYRRDMLCQQFVDDVFTYDWSWVNKYIEVDKYFQYIKKFVYEDKGKSPLPYWIPL